MPHGIHHTMNIKYKDLVLESIDLSDSTFVISYGFSISKLRDSIEKIGVINPPLVREEPGGKYRLVCGYKRLLVCRDIGVERLRCAVVGRYIEDKDALLINLYDNLSHRDLNPVEKSIAIGKLQEYYTDETIVKNFLPLLRLNPHYSIFNRVRSLSGLEREIKDAVVNGRLDEGAAIKLLGFSKNDRVLLFEVLSALRFSKNKQNEVIDNIYDITKRDECSVSDVLDSTELKDILSNKDLNIPQRGGKMRRFLKKLRYPKIVKAEEGFMEILRGLNLGDRIRLIPPPYFEGEKYNIEFQFGTIDELEENLEKIDSVKYDKGFRSLIED